jgi:hypothetical protein
VQEDRVIESGCVEKGSGQEEGGPGGSQTCTKWQRCAMPSSFKNSHGVEIRPGTSTWCLREGGNKREGIEKTTFLPFSFLPSILPLFTR